MNINDPAFPINEFDQHINEICANHLGITKREYFAAKAMQACIIAAGSWGPCEFKDFNVDEVAKFAYRQADAMDEIK